MPERGKTKLPHMRAEIKPWTYKAIIGAVALGLRDIAAAIRELAAAVRESG